MTDIRKLTVLEALAELDTLDELQPVESEPFVDAVKQMKKNKKAVDDMTAKQHKDMEEFKKKTNVTESLNEAKAQPFTLYEEEALEELKDICFEEARDLDNSGFESIEEVHEYVYEEMFKNIDYIAANFYNVYAYGGDDYTGTDKAVVKLKDGRMYTMEEKEMSIFNVVELTVAEKVADPETFNLEEFFGKQSGEKLEAAIRSHLYDLLSVAAPQAHELESEFDGYDSEWCEVDGASTLSIRADEALNKYVDALMEVYFANQILSEEKKEGNENLTESNNVKVEYVFWWDEEGDYGTSDAYPDFESCKAACIRNNGYSVEKQTTPVDEKGTPIGDVECKEVWPNPNHDPSMSMNDWDYQDYDDIELPEALNESYSKNPYKLILSEASVSEVEEEEETSDEDNLEEVEELDDTDIEDIVDNTEEEQSDENTEEETTEEEPQEDVVDEIEEPTDEVQPEGNIENGTKSIFTSALSDAWAEIDNYNSAIATLEAENGNEEVIAILRELVNDAMTKVGQLERGLGLVDPSIENIETGKEETVETEEVVDAEVTEEEPVEETENTDVENEEEQPEVEEVKVEQIVAL